MKYMPRWLRNTLIIFLILIFLIAGALGFFIYKVKYGIPNYQTEPVSITIPEDEPAILLYSKTTGFRHGEAINTSKLLFEKMAEEEDWFLYETEKSGIINPEQLAQFDVIIWNNSTGKGLTEEQRKAVQSYVENGGGLLGIHGAGDDSHNWEWYEENLLGARFSHHPIENQLQETTVLLEPNQDSIINNGLPQKWPHIDEWYVFFQNPRDKGFNIVCTIDGDAIDSNGNIFWITSKNFGMGKDHPIAWSKDIQQGRTFYTSMGHNSEAISNENFKLLLRNAIKWTGKLD